MAATLTFPPEEAAKLEGYLPPSGADNTADPNAAKPWVTLTYASSLDSALALRPGVQTVLSGPQSKAMTHYLRSRHDAILVGVGTATADDPGLNCRIAGAEARQPRPVVLDPYARWQVGADSKVVRLAREGKGLAPFVISGVRPDDERRRAVEAVGGKYIYCSDFPQDPEGLSGHRAFKWEAVLEILREEGLRSVMVEGGGKIINSLLGSAGIRLVDSVIVTIAPTWLGKGGVVVSPDREGGEGGNSAAARLSNVRWCPLGEDVVMCGFPEIR